LQSNLGHSQIRFSQLGQLVEGCQQQPCLVRIAGRALAEGCVAPQAIVSQASGKLSNVNVPSSFITVFMIHQV